ncbi:DNA-binding protein D-ETS-4 isoform X2 [Phlebotomus argentipes]|uniref:DNA-binding protein D-ETS-4 isoform X2 n=1 Tax=Phlebotomus argentipes TaxID=94469 RepID=UPI0028934758|nr:DNA-binding protein D-ETS-4 isoform X2 [Phlebotomus argentipes]
MTRRKQTPQTVPAGVYTPDAYTSYADNFDLSLLPSDGEVPLSPDSQECGDFIPTTVPKAWSHPDPAHFPYFAIGLPSPPQEPIIGVFSPSPSPVAELTVKQEFALLPPSPPDSSGVPSPFCVKSEPTDSDTETCIDLDSFLQKSLEDFEAPKRQDHQLLREYLQDTTFQKKHNLKPLALESLIGGWGTRGDIEPVISLALEHARRDVQATCATLSISPDPQQWTTVQVQAWLQLTIEQFKLPPVKDLETLFMEDGPGLYQMSEEEFVRRAPQVGGTLYAQLEIWKAACSDAPQIQVPTSSAGNNLAWSPEGSQSAEPSDDEDEEMPLAPVDVASGQKSNRQGSSHIHLWQFLKELLASPQKHGTAIRWLDRNKGVFKIEDSVRVAKLWGQRKNRPAMNYDKLSRSIRQYYKKGIMKKTERSQRLVYQFCHPYCL